MKCIPLTKWEQLLQKEYFIFYDSTYWRSATLILLYLCLVIMILLLFPLLFSVTTLPSCSFFLLAYYHIRNYLLFILWILYFDLKIYVFIFNFWHSNCLKDDIFRSQNEQRVEEKETDKEQGLGEDEDDDEG